MGIKICKNCGKTFSTDVIGYGNICPIYDCEGELFECDTMMVPTVTTLLEKGYETTFSCGGHFGGRLHDIYVATKAYPTEEVEKLVPVMLETLREVYLKGKYEIPIRIEIHGANDPEYPFVNDVKHEYKKIINSDYIITHPQNELKSFENEISHANGNWKKTEFKTLKITSRFEDKIKDVDSVGSWHETNRVIYDFARKLPYFYEVFQEKKEDVKDEG